MFSIRRGVETISLYFLATQLASTYRLNKLNYSQCFFQQIPEVLVWDYMYPENIVKVHGGKITAQNKADGIRYMFSFHIPKAHDMLAD